MPEQKPLPKGLRKPTPRQAKEIRKLLKEPLDAWVARTNPTPEEREIRRLLEASLALGVRAR